MTKDRRSTETQPLRSWEATDEPVTYHGYEDQFRHEDGTGLFKLQGVLLFVKFLIDVSQQTSINEFQVFPACLVSISTDRIEKQAAAGSLDEGSQRLVHALGTALADRTRQADKAGRSDRTFTVLLARTMARNVREHYVPRIAEQLHRVAKDAGVETAFAFGIASLTEHLVTDPDDMLAKSLRALEAAQQREPEAMRRGPATVAVYDFRTMPLD
ncbi:MAG: hypothetical protein PVF27_08025 [Gemmatimonadales bacterium]|jgi:hypothetical protein